MQECLHQFISKFTHVLFCHSSFCCLKTSKKHKKPVFYRNSRCQKKRPPRYCGKSASQPDLSGQLAEPSAAFRSVTQSAASRLGDLMARRNDAITIGVRIGLRRPRSFGGVMGDGRRLAMVFVACGVVVFVWLVCMVAFLYLKWNRERGLQILVLQMLIGRKKSLPKNGVRR